MVYTSNTTLPSIPLVEAFPRAWRAMTKFLNSPNARLRRAASMGDAVGMDGAISDGATDILAAIRQAKHMGMVDVLLRYAQRAGSSDAQVACGEEAVRRAVRVQDGARLDRYMNENRAKAGDALRYAAGRGQVTMVTHLLDQHKIPPQTINAVFAILIGDDRTYVRDPTGGMMVATAEAIAPFVTDVAGAVPQFLPRLGTAPSELVYALHRTGWRCDQDTFGRIRDAVKDGDMSQVRVFTLLESFKHQRTLDDVCDITSTERREIDQMPPDVRAERLARARNSTYYSPPLVLH